MMILRGMRLGRMVCCFKVLWMGQWLCAMVSEDFYLHNRVGLPHSGTLIAFQSSIVIVKSILSVFWCELLTL
jgi:hypothetical protein